MKCESCGVDTQTGQRYTFYYGSLTGASTTGRLTVTNYRIAGRQDLFLCDTCVARHSEMNARKLGLILLVVPLLIGLCFLSPIFLGLEGYGFEQAKPLMPILWLALLGPFVYLIRRSVWKRGTGGVGDSLAIKLRRPELKKAGFDSFFTREEYKRMGGVFQG